MQAKWCMVAISNFESIRLLEVDHKLYLLVTVLAANIRIYHDTFCLSCRLSRINLQYLCHFVLLPFSRRKTISSPSQGLKLTVIWIRIGSAIKA